MYDSIKLYLRQDSIRDTDLRAEIPIYLDKYTEHRNEHEIYYSGTLENLRINLSERGISIKGSLAKYYLSNNLLTLSRQDTEQAITKLSDDLHVPIQNAKVTRLDFAHNFVMNYKPEIYYPYLGESRYFKRYSQPNSIRYENSNRAKLFYNKLSEAKYRSCEIPQSWTDKNVLRYEIRYNRRLPKQLKEPKVKTYTLYDEGFYTKLIERYKIEYESIHKNLNLSFDFFTDFMNTPKNVKEQLALIGLMTVGENRFIELVEEWREKGVLKKNEYYSRTKREMRELVEKFKYTDSPSLIDELDHKIKTVDEVLR